MNGFFTLLEAAAHFAKFETNMKFAHEAILTEWAVTVRDRAKAAIGTYKYRWPELAEATQQEREKQGYPANEPLLLTGKLRDSISAFVEMHGPESGRAVVGTPEEIGLWQEIGTKHIPPRPFLSASARASQADLGKIAKKYIRSAWISAGRDNEILHLLHAIKLVLEVAKHVYDGIEKLSRKSK